MPNRCVLASVQQLFMLLLNHSYHCGLSFQQLVGLQPFLLFLARMSHLRDAGIRLRLIEPVPGQTGDNDNTTRTLIIPPTTCDAST